MGCLGFEPRATGGKAADEAMELWQPPEEPLLTLSPLNDSYKWTLAPRH